MQFPARAAKHGLIRSLHVKAIQFIAQAHKQKRRIVGKLLTANETGHTLIGAWLKLAQKSKSLRYIEYELKADLSEVISNLGWLSQ